MAHVGAFEAKDVHSHINREQDIWNWLIGCTTPPCCVQVKEQAVAVGRKIHEEDGAAKAVDAFHRCAPGCMPCQTFAF